MTDLHVQRAAEWFVRLRSPDVSSSDKRAHERWLEDSTDNRAAWSEVERHWRDLDQLEFWARGELSQLNLESGVRSRRRSRLWSVGFASAAVLVAVIGMLAWWPASESIHIETMKTEQRKLALDDGSLIHLNSATALEVNFTADVRSVELRQGEGFFDVGHDEARPFVVRAGNHLVTAIGTRFSVHLDDGGLEVTVVEGRVAIVPDDSSSSSSYRRTTTTAGADADAAQKVFLSPNRQARFASGGALEALREVKAGNETAWLEGKLIFEETPLREAVKEMSRYIPGRVSVAEGVADHPVTGIIQIRSTEVMLELLTRAVPVTAVKESANLTVLYDAS